MKDIHIKLVYLILGIMIARLNEFIDKKMVLVVIPILSICLGIHLFKHAMQWSREVNPTPRAIILFKSLNFYGMMIIVTCVTVTVYLYDLLMNSGWFLAANKFTQFMLLGVPIILGSLILSYTYNRVVDYYSRK